MRESWLQLKRLLGISPATPTYEQEGQLRYVRDDGETGVLYLARGEADDTTYTWESVVVGTPTSAPTIFTSAVDDSTTVVSGTSSADILSADLLALVDGVTYDIELTVTMRGSIDTTGYIIAQARIGSDSTATGTRTGTVAGERTIGASAVRLAYVGTGSNVTTRARARMDSAVTGSVTGVQIVARAIPRNG